MSAGRIWPALPIALLAIGCSTSPQAEGGLDAGDDASGPCLLCGSSGAPEDLDASLAFKVRARFRLCDGVEGCHVSGAATLTYPVGNEFANVIDVPSFERPELLRVKPGDPSNSYLYLKVHGDGGIEGGRMPLNAPTYDPKIPDTIFAWIEAGAPQQ